MDSDKGMEGSVFLKKPVEEASDQLLRQALSSYSERRRKKILGLPIGRKERVYPYKDQAKTKSREELLQLINK
jgi:hypothetical protein